jgi:hypothetical protein
MLAAITACATIELVTPRQAKIRAALEACNSATGRRSYDLKVNSDGKFTWRSPARTVTMAMKDCMRAKGFTLE